MSYSALSHPVPLQRFAGALAKATQRKHGVFWRCMALRTRALCKSILAAPLWSHAPSRTSASCRGQALSSPDTSRGSRSRRPNGTQGWGSGAGSCSCALSLCSWRGFYFYQRFTLSGCQALRLVRKYEKAEEFHVYWNEQSVRLVQILTCTVRKLLQDAWCVSDKETQ